MLNYILGLTALSFGTSKVIEYSMNNQDTKVEPPVDTVSIIMPSFNEERFISSAVYSIRNQSIMKSYPDKFEFILVDSGSKDKTVQLSIPFVDKVITAPRGKLTARNLATLNSKGNIIVSVDADTIYPLNWLNTLLKSFINPNVKGVVGSTYDSSIPYVPASLYILSNTLKQTILRPDQMIGRNSAYYKHDFYRLGMFNTNINQQDGEQVLKEEEIDFGKKLSKLGIIEFKINASVIHLGGSRVGCRIGLTNKELCKSYGIKIERFGGLL